MWLLSEEDSTHCWTSWSRELSTSPLTWAGGQPANCWLSWSWKVSCCGEMELSSGSSWDDSTEWWSGSSWQDSSHWWSCCPRKDSTFSWMVMSRTRLVGDLKFWGWGEDSFCRSSSFACRSKHAEKWKIYPNSRKFQKKKKKLLAQNDYVKKSLLAILYMANIWSTLIWTKILLHKNF